MSWRAYIRKIVSSLYALAGSFIMAAGWSWCHISKHPKWIFVPKAIAVWGAVYVAYRVGKFIFREAARRTRRHSFWQEQFVGFLDRLWFYFSLLFVIFFLKSELLSVVYISAAFFLLYWRLQHYLSHHPHAAPWIAVTKNIFVLAFGLFLAQAAVQYAAYHYYILDSNIRFFNIVLFRSVAMTLFWLFGFVVASFLYWKISSWARYIPVIVWAGVFFLVMAMWTVNLGILYYSGLYISPVALEHLAGSHDVVATGITWYLVGGLAAVLVVFVFVFRKFISAHRLAPKRYWYFYHAAIALAAMWSFFGLTSFRNTPEHAIFKSFYDYFWGTDEKIVLDKSIQVKLEKFGLRYNPDTFYIGERERVFSSAKKLLPDRLVKNKPNILIVFLESFSARLTDVYNPGFTDLTPGLDAMAADPHTTIFKNYYNASTPTITGTLSQLCSFLPPTGHNEIQNERKLQNHHLLCLPEVLEKYAGVKYSAYVTAVDKEFAHKDGIFTSMGVDKIYGTEELKESISGEPLSWGYSDHQLFPATWNFMQEAPQPFLMMLATVDTHPPFTLAKDEVKYKDGKQPVLNSFHTTDDAFGKFWKEFSESPLYKNTIVIAVADHAIFPGALTQDIVAWKGSTDRESMRTFYDQNFFTMYIPDNVLPKEVARYASGIDVAPTLLQILNINIPNSFEGHSIFDDREKYPNLLGMHELGLYINQVNGNGKRKVDYNVPSEIECAANYTSSSTPDLTLCDYLQFYKWKRQMFEEGRFWKKF